MTPFEARCFTEAVANWVRGEPALRGLALAGSWARGAARPDSDLDLIILTDSPHSFRSDLRWLDRIVLPDPYRVNEHRGAVYGAVWSCHAMLAPAGELELSFSTPKWTATDPIDDGTRRVVSDGFSIIVDKDGHLQRVVEAVKRSK